MEQEMNQLYRKIAETVNAMIPEKWVKFCVYAQVSETGGGTYFFYNTPEDEFNYKYSLELPFEFNINNEQFNQRERNLFELSDKPRKVFSDYQQELWYSFTLSLDNNGNFKIHYDYTNWFDTNYSFDDQLILWECKYLGNKPDDVESKDLIERYLNEYPDNPI
ncbi:immunity protein YezG family protein [Priestia koreensis]|uniref:immunity protein YezG family protein n=1 Tax=Priestia koreensis TaxID=284581 RepID=UPI001F5877EB|nr:immunity protein YezG family protein [Priestia koreensis]UNL87271.1 DUF600 family protein [Priestia koreensis]